MVLSSRNKLKTKGLNSPNRPTEPTQGDLFDAYSKEFSAPKNVVAVGLDGSKIYDALIETIASIGDYALSTSWEIPCKLYVTKPYDGRIKIAPKKTIVVSEKADEKELFWAIQNEASHYVACEGMRGDWQKRLTLAIDDTLNSETMSKKVLTAVGFEMTKCPFSADELSMIECMANGFTGKQIAEKMGIQPQTVKNKLSKIYAEFGEQNEPWSSAKLVAHVVRMGWIN